MEWALARRSCRGRFERGRSEALDVGGDEGELGLEPKARVDLLQIDFRQLETLLDVWTL